MKTKIITLIIGMMLCSCTYYGVECPCKVITIEANSKRERIFVENQNNQSFTFYTTSLNYYHLGDTIK